jgi:hypothetical protein
MNDWPASHYYPPEGEYPPDGEYPLEGEYRPEGEPAARSPGPGRHALRLGVARHAAGTHPPWSGAEDRDEDLAWSPPGAPGPLEHQDDGPGVPPPGPGSLPGGELAGRRPPRRVPSSRGRYPRRRFPRWLAVAGGGVVVLIAVVAVMAGHPGTGAARLTGRAAAASPASRGGTPGAGPQPVITRTAAQQLLARYARVNNQANRLRSNALLATIEAGSSLMMDAGAYQLERATDPANSKYVLLGLQNAVYCIPRQRAADWPHFFVAEVRYADLARPGHVTGTGFLLFAQASPGASWQDVIEPYLIPAVAPAPAIAVDAQGYAQPVSITGSTSGLSTAPRQIQPDTIRWLDREAAAGADPADTGNLADLRDVIFWRGELPSGTVTSTHSAGPGPAFGLRTDGGGALFFYSLTARLRLLAPPGDAFHVSIPGYYSPGQSLRSATVGYIEQFAAFDPARGKGGPRAVAAASSIAGRG